MEHTENQCWYELILDLHHCDPATFGRKNIEQFMVEVCEAADMKRADLHFWDYEGDDEGKRSAPPHMKGTSAIQFIYTSNITVHTLDEYRAVYINAFSCKKFDIGQVMGIAEARFHGVAGNCRGFNRELPKLQEA